MAKAKKKKVVETPGSLDLVIKAKEKKYGTGTIALLDESSLELQTVSTGSLGLDAALGRGGVALGRIYEFYGSQGSGKSSLAFSVIAEAQKAGFTCAFADVEKSLDPKLLYGMGVDGKKLYMINVFGGEENLEVCEDMVKSEDVDILVIDSVSALLPRAESDKSIDQDSIGLLARLMSKCMRRFAPLAHQTQTMVIFINQIRMEIGKYGDPRKSTGGEALSFFATGRIKVDGGESKSSRIVNSDGAVVGHDVSFEIVKNKLAPPYRKAVVPLIYGIGFHKEWETVRLATDLDILVKKGAWYSYDGKNVAQGEMNMVTKFEEEADFYEEVREKVKRTLGVGDLEDE